MLSFKAEQDKCRLASPVEGSKNIPLLWFLTEPYKEKVMNSLREVKLGEFASLAILGIITWGRKTVVTFLLRVNDPHWYRYQPGHRAEEMPEFARWLEHESGMNWGTDPHNNERGKILFQTGDDPDGPTVLGFRVFLRGCVEDPDRYLAEMAQRLSQVLEDLAKKNHDAETASQKRQQEQEEEYYRQAEEIESRMRR